MLSINGIAEHAQPMAPQVDDDRAAIWYFTKKQSYLYRQIESPTPALFTIISDDRAYHASVRGCLMRDANQARIEQFWNPITAAWFQNGQTDPELALLRLTPGEAHIWASTGNPLKFAWEIAKANLTDGEPALGCHVQVTF